MNALALDLAQDVRFAVRQARKAPTFTLLAVLAIALGIGASAAIFSVLDATLLRLLPYDHPERVVIPSTRSQLGWNQPYSWPGFQDLQRDMHSFTAVAGYDADGTINLERGTGAVALHGVHVTGQFFSVFGVKPLLGRTLTPVDERTGISDRAVLGYETWQQYFQGDPSIVGRTVRLDGRPVVVVGVMPAGFRFPISVRDAVYTQLYPQEVNRNQRGNHWLLAVARLAPGVSPEQAHTELTTLLKNLARAYPDSDGGRTGKVVPYAASLIRGQGAALWLLLGAAGALLGIACVNLAGLLLARGVRREREMALRTAIGANPGRLLRQLLTEGLLLSFIGAVLGVVLAIGMLAGMRTFLIAALQRGAEVQMNWRVVAVSVLISVLAGVAASLLPALRLRALDPNRTLKSGGNAGTARSQQRIRSGFIVAQIALSLSLLAVAALLLGSVSKLRRQPLGFDPTKLVSLHLRLSPATYAHRDMVQNFYRPFIERVEALPGVQSAAVISMLPVQSSGSNMNIQIVGHAPLPPKLDIPAEVRIISADFPRTMGLQLKDGRLLSQTLDGDSGAASHDLVNEAFHRRFFSPGEPAVGAHLNDAPKAEGRSQIVGVVSNLSQSLFEPPMAEIDLLLDAMPMKYQADQLSSMNLLVRSDRPASLSIALRKALHDVDPTVPFEAPELMTDVVADQLVLQRMESWIFGVFASAAILLALIGLYGLVSQEVESGTRDIGVRMALGATRLTVLRIVLQRVVLLAVAGTGTGLLLVAGTHRILQSLLPVAPGHQALQIALLACGVMLISLLACLPPAHRAAALDPMRALRTE